MMFRFVLKSGTTLKDVAWSLKSDLTGYFAGHLFVSSMDNRLKARLLMFPFPPRLLKARFPSEVMEEIRKIESCLDDEEKNIQMIRLMLDFQKQHLQK